MSRIFNKAPRNLLLAFMIFALLLFLFSSFLVTDGFAFRFVGLVNGLGFVLKFILLFMGHNHSLVVSVALLHILNLFSYDCVLDLNGTYPMILPSDLFVNYTAAEVLHSE